MSYWVQRKLQFEQRLKEDLELAWTTEATKEWRDKGVAIQDCGYLLGRIKWADYEFKKQTFSITLMITNYPHAFLSSSLKQGFPGQDKGRKVIWAPFIQ